FNFTEDDCHDMDLERLRGAWTVLQRVPEGRVVTIDNGSETIRAYRSMGELVLEPHRESGNDHHSRIKIPDYIVNAFLDDDGRLPDDDIRRLAKDHGKITLVKVNSDLGGVTVWMNQVD